MSGSDKKYNILKAASWYTIGNILVKSVSFFVLPIFTKLMSTTEYGIYSVYVSYVTIFEVLILLGLSSTVRIAKFDKKTDFNKYVSTVICLPVLLTLFVMLFINGKFLISSGDLLSMNQTLWNYLLVTSAASAVAGIIGARLVIDAKYKAYLAYSLINTILNVAISLILCYTVFKEHDIHMARVIGQCASAVVSALFLMIITKAKPKICKEYVKTSLKWGIPLLFHTLATIILTQSDRIIINYLNGYSAAGIYSIAVTLITIPLTLQTSFESAWAPWFYKKLEEKNYQSIFRVNNLYIIGFGIIIILFMLVSPDIIHIFTDESYWDSAYCLIPLSISVFGEMLYCLPVNVEYYNQKTKYVMWGTIFTAILNIILDIIFILIFGYVGAAYATAISKMLLFIFHYLLSKKIDSHTVFSNKLVIIMMIIMIAVNIITVLTVEQTIFRWIIVLLILTILGIIGVKNKCYLKKSIE